MEPHNTPQGKIADEFARALIAGKFDRAHHMLNSSAQATWDAAALQTAYLQMVEYFESPPNFVQVMEVMTEWPDRQPDDVGWAYAAIAGADGSEAVTIVVTSEDGQHRIRNIEWGRP